MSRLGDTIREARIKYGMTEKQLAKKTGTAENFIKEVESGRRIPSDDQARRLLKAMGAKNPVSTELEVAAEPEVKLRPRPMPYVIQVPEDQPKPTKKEMEEKTASNDAWLDALGGVVKRVPVIDEKGLAIDHVLFPIISGKIEGGAPDKVLMFRCPDNSLSGFRVFAGDLLLVVPEKAPVDEAFMLVFVKGKRMVRKIKKLDGSKIMLQSYDREFESDTVMWAEIQILGRCVKLQRTL
ncbi:MAG: helix-turn-helix domain-containing protein [Clostridia bacterium]|nr:helix-turn-helix domain-containing protein [Clostridia bacterium]